MNKLLISLLFFVSLLMSTSLPAMSAEKEYSLQFVSEIERTNIKGIPDLVVDLDNNGVFEFVDYERKVKELLVYSAENGRLNYKTSYRPTRSEIKKIISWIDVDGRKYIVIATSESIEWLSYNGSKLLLHKSMPLPESYDPGYIHAIKYLGSDSINLVAGRVTRKDPRYDNFSQDTLFTWSGDSYRKIWESPDTYRLGRLYVFDIDNDGKDELVYEISEGPMTYGFTIYKYLDEKFTLYYEDDDLLDFDTPQIAIGNFISKDSEQILILSGDAYLAIWDANRMKIQKLNHDENYFPFQMSVVDINNDGLDEIILFEKNKVRVYSVAQ